MFLDELDQFKIGIRPSVSSLNSCQAANIRNSSRLTSVEPVEQQNRSAPKANQAKIRHANARQSSNLKRDILPSGHIIRIRWLRKLRNAQSTHSITH